VAHSASTTMVRWQRSGGMVAFVGDEGGEVVANDSGVLLQISEG
jgi:hypothetical protein